mmetsp:Transcript_85493/g.198723  ORF Transcript_85493/g.198723 Transcript_85493/m.198723 type:complete len:295 (-) Transcript_85493:849-1733(-)
MRQVFHEAQMHPRLRHCRGRKVHGLPCVGVDHHEGAVRTIPQPRCPHAWQATDRVLVLMQTHLDVFHGRVHSESLVPLAVVHNPNFLHPFNRLPALVALLRGPAGARVTRAVLVFVLAQAGLDLFKGYILGEICIPFRVFVDAIRDDPEDALVAGCAIRGSVARTLHVNLLKRLHGLAAAGHRAELRLVSIVLPVQEGLNLLKTRMFRQAFVPFVVLLKVGHGPTNIAIASLTCDGCVAIAILLIHLVQTLQLSVTCKLVALLFLVLLCLEVARLGADVLRVEVVLHCLEVRIL